MTRFLQFREVGVRFGREDLFVLNAVLRPDVWDPLRKTGAPPLPKEPRAWTLKELARHSGLDLEAGEWWDVEVIERSDDVLPLPSLPVPRVGAVGVRCGRLVEVDEGEEVLRAVCAALEKGLPGLREPEVVLPRGGQAPLAP